MIKYISTRSDSDPKSFTDILLSGTVPDGGLYMPDSWPELDFKLLHHLQGMGYVDVAQQVIQPFIGDDIKPDILLSLLESTYSGDAFDHAALIPLRQLGPNSWIMELFHGPTLSFKDYALQFLGKLFDHVLEERQQNVTIIGATSGDTGSAAIEACKGSEFIDIYILHPQNRTSDVQRRQMTGVHADNVHNIAIDGTFDDCQAIVKALFADKAFNEERHLSAINSINWARIMMQMVYYVCASISLGTPARPVSFTVPTGNFGNVFAAWGARHMGLPIHKLVVASNRNDILTRFFETGTMDVTGVESSLSPSMDIQISSNFERFLSEIMMRDYNEITSLMGFLKNEGKFKVSEELKARINQEFVAKRCNDEETLEMMKTCYDATGMFIDPHTAVGLHAAMQVIEEDPDVPMVSLACAHPAKFPAAVEKAIGEPAPVPKKLENILKKAERYMTLPNDPEKVKEFIQENSPV